MKIIRFIAFIFLSCLCGLSLSKDLNDKLFTGRHIEKYQNGNNKYEVHYVNGKKEGLETFWYNSGLKYIETNYINDKEDGVWKQWYESGQLKLEAHYKDGKEHGLFTQWYDNGAKRSEATFKDGKKKDMRLTGKKMVMSNLKPYTRMVSP